MAVTQLLPNYNVYLELSATSNTITSGRNALQKKILSLLRKIEHPTQGNKQAWYDTFVYQQTLTKLFQSCPKSSKSDESSSFSPAELNSGSSSSSVAAALHHARLNKRRNNCSVSIGSMSSLSNPVNSSSNL